MSQRKTGPLSTEEKEYIRQNAGQFDEQDIADSLNRKVGLVRAFIVDYVGTESNRSKLEAQARVSLRTRPEWKCWEKQFTPDELKYLEYSFAKYSAQFNNDIYPTEEKQLFQIIELEILCNAIKAERRRTLQDLEVFESLINAEMKKDNEDRDKDLIMNCENQLQVLHSANHSRLDKLKMLMDKSQQLMEAIKGTRNQRVKNIESHKKSFVDYLKDLENEDYRNSQGVESEIMKIATTKEFKRLSDYHNYLDGTADRPLLTPETVMLDEN